MRKFKSVIIGALALALCFTLASCKKGKCDNYKVCGHDDVYLRKVEQTADVWGTVITKTYWYCSDCYKTIKKK